MSFTDFIELQTDAAQALLADEWLNNVNIVTRERLLADESKLPDKTLAAEVLAYITPRNGRKGCAIIVEKPEIEVNRPNLPGPQCEIVLAFLVLEEPLMNNAPSTGTLKPSDQVGQRILEVMHGWQDESLGQFYADRVALSPAKEWEPLRAFRARLRLVLQRTQTERAATPTATESEGTVTLACTTSDAIIRYTTDQSFPGSANPVAQVYAAPFAVAAGDVLRFAAYKTNLLGSHVGQATVT